MKVTKKKISRRTVLRGAGTVLGLPLLDAMIPAMTATAATVAAPNALRRIGYVYMPMGFNPAEWIPEGETLEQLPSSLRSLEKVKNQVTVVTNSDLQNAYPGSHATSNSAFLSAARAKRTESTDYYLGTTVDQIAAKQIGQQTQLPSLELSMDMLANVGQCDNGYACVYQNNLSWSSPTTPLPSEAHPRMVFESLFGEGGTPEQRPARAPSSGQFAGLGDRGSQTTETARRCLGSQQNRQLPDQYSRGRASNYQGRGDGQRQSVTRSRSARRRSGGLPGSCAIDV